METKRLIFVKMDKKYIDFYLENINNPEIYQHINTKPNHYTYECEIEWLKQNKDLYQYTIIEKETGLPVANAGYNKTENNIGELGIWVTPKAQNKKYGREILNKLIEFGYQELHLKRIVLTVHENNEKAFCLYKSLGFYKVGWPKAITDGLGNPTKKIHMILKKKKEGINMKNNGTYPS